ncbi:MAG: TonB-dependent receptor [Steroidobacteraceae bacterium]
MCRCRCRHSARRRSRSCASRAPTTSHASRPGSPTSRASAASTRSGPWCAARSNILGAANASFFVDGVYVSGPSVSTETANLERIEVIKGPQAALYGRATFAGAINYITKRPTNEFSGKLLASYGTHDEIEYSGSVSGPLVRDRLFYYVAARSWEYGGEYTNAIDGQLLDRESTHSFTAKLLWTPAENFELTLLGTYSMDDDNGGLPLGLQGRQYNNCQLQSITGNTANNFAGSQFPRSPGYYCGTVKEAGSLVTAARTDVMADPGLERSNARGALTAKYTFGGGYELASITSYHDEQQETQVDVSYAGYDAFILFGPTQTGAFWRRGEESRNDFSQELRVRSPAESRLRWLAGVYYFKASDDTTRDDKFVPQTASLAIRTGAGCQQLTATVTTCPNSQGTLAERDITNKAVFADLEFDFTEQLTATLEARYAKENQEQKNIFALPPFCNPAQPTATGGTFNACLFTGEFKSTTPRATLRYKATPDQTYYLNWAKGTKPGGFNTATSVLGGIAAGIPVRAAYDEEESKAWELGAKWVLFDNRLRLNAALFKTDLTGQQLTSNIAATVNGNTVLNSYIDNIGETSIRGLELEAEAILTERWDMRGTFSYVRAKIDKFVDNNQAALYSPVGAFRATQSPTTVTLLCNVRGAANPVAGRPFCDDAQNADLLAYGDVAGKYAPRVPKVEASLVANYSLPIEGERTLRFSIDATYEGSKYGQVDNLAETGAHTYVGSRLGFGKTWTVTLRGKNLLDDKTSLDILRYIDTRTGFLANNVTPRGFVMTLPRGRQVGVSASVKF